MNMPTIKTLICEVREASDQLRDDSNFDDGTAYRILYDDDQIIENTTDPILATAEALAARGHTPDTLFALVDGDGVHCVIPIEYANCCLWA
jgi:hypothetical protein